MRPVAVAALRAPGRGVNGDGRRGWPRCGAAMLRRARPVRCALRCAALRLVGWCVAALDTAVPVVSPGGPSARPPSLAVAALTLGLCWDEKGGFRASSWLWADFADVRGGYYPDKYYPDKEYYNGSPLLAGAAQYFSW